MKRFSEKFLAIVGEEAAQLLTGSRRRGELIWDEFASVWFRVVRRIVFGDAARDDHVVTDLIARLRGYANWAFLSRQRPGVRDRFLRRVSEHLARAEPGSLASVMAAVRATDETAPSHQVPQWLFAFDPAGMTTFRTLALLATHPAQMDMVRHEIRDRHGSDLPYLRACVLESLRLWPTAPLVLRQSTEETIWEGGSMPAQTGIILFAPFFHRDDERVPFADRFAPDVWLEDRPAEDWPFIPFSAGPARCPGRQLVLLLTSAMVAALVDRREVVLKPPARLDPRQPLPGTLNNYALRFRIGA
jgi:cytochrome P450